MRKKRLKEPKQVPVYAVLWTDATKYEDAPHTPTTALGVTVGFLLEDTHEHIVIAQEVFDDGEYRSVVCIPRGMVKALAEIGNCAIPREA